MKYSFIDANKKIVFYLILATIISTLLKAYTWYIPIYLLFLTYIVFKDNNFRKITAPFKIRKAGEEGEKKVSEILNQLGFNKFIVMNDLNLKIRKIESQIDHIVIGNNGIFNIETKNYRGVIEVLYDKNIVQRTSKGEVDIKGFITQVNHHYNTLNGIFNGDIPIYNLIVIANEKTIIINGEKSPVPIISISELKDYLENFKGENKTIKKEKVCEVIEEFTQRPFDIFKKKSRYFVKNYKATFKVAFSALAMFLLLFSLNNGNIFKIIDLNGGEASVANSFTGKKIVLDNSSIELKVKEIDERELGVFITLENDKAIDFNKLKMYLVDINEERTQGIQYSSKSVSDKVFLFQGIDSLNGVYKIKINYDENGKVYKKEINPKEF